MMSLWTRPAIPCISTCHCGLDPQSPVLAPVIAGLTRNPLIICIIFQGIPRQTRDDITLIYY